MNYLKLRKTGTMNTSMSDNDDDDDDDNMMNKKKKLFFVFNNIGFLVKLP